MSVEPLTLLFVADHRLRRPTVGCRVVLLFIFQLLQLLRSFLIFASRDTLVALLLLCVSLRSLVRLLRLVGDVRTRSRALETLLGLRLRFWLCLCRSLSLRRFGSWFFHRRLARAASLRCLGRLGGRSTRDRCCSFRGIQGLCVRKRHSQNKWNFEFHGMPLLEPNTPIVIILLETETQETGNDTQKTLSGNLRN